MIQTRALSKVYQTDGASIAALRGVDLQVDAGSYVAVMGPSGCGKSTLLHLIGALDTPSAGEVLLEGRDLSSLGDRERTELRLHKIGFVFQFFNLVPVLSAEDNVALPLVIAGVRAAAVRERVARILDEVGLTERSGQLPSQLSGGEQQRVAIARALVTEPAIVLADEPTGNLDHATGLEVLELLRRFHERGQTIVLVTHDPSVASQAEAVLFMRDGEIVDRTQLEKPGDPAAVLSKIVRLESQR